MKKIVICTLLLLFAVSDIANGKGGNPVSNQDRDEEEIGNFDFLYFDEDGSNADFIIQESLMEEAFSHLGTRYRSGAKGPNAFDCSGFTSYVYKQQTNVFIGSCSRDQYAINQPITRDEIQCGDLVFFTSPRSGRGVGHVGIVVDVDPATHNFTFIHASSKNGVKLSSISEPSYARRYVGVRRVQL